MKTTTTFLRKLHTGSLLLLLLLLLLLCCGALGARGARGQSDAPVEKLWDKAYGGSFQDQLTSIVATEDGGFLLGGGSNSDAEFEKSKFARRSSSYLW